MGRFQSHDRHLRTRYQPLQRAYRVFNRQRDTACHREHPAPGAQHWARPPRAPTATSSSCAGPTPEAIPSIMLAPGGLWADCYTLTIQAFNLAERYRCPVFSGLQQGRSASPGNRFDIEALERPRNYRARLCPGGRRVSTLQAPCQTARCLISCRWAVSASAAQTSSTHGEKRLHHQLAGGNSRSDQAPGIQAGKATVGEYSFHDADMQDGAETPDTHLRHYCPRRPPGRGRASRPRGEKVSLAVFEDPVAGFPRS